MVRRIAELRATPNDVLIAEHDEAAAHTFVGTDYYVRELDRRSRDRATEAAHRLAEVSHLLAARTFWLAVASSDQMPQAGEAIREDWAHRCPLSGGRSVG